MLLSIQQVASGRKLPVDPTVQPPYRLDSEAHSKARFSMRPNMRRLQPQQQGPQTQTRTVATTINPIVNWGIWEGWGVSLAWWGKAFGRRSDVADVFFTLRSNLSLNGYLVPGLGLNIVRYNAGASGFHRINGTSSMVQSPNIHQSRQIEGYWLDGRSTDPSSSSWEWSLDANQRNMMLMAKARGADNYELFSNSPMWLVGDDMLGDFSSKPCNKS